MEIYLQPIDEKYFLICGSTQNLEKELHALGAFSEINEEGLNIWKARHLHRFKFEYFIETGKIFVKWNPSMMLEIKLNDLDQYQNSISIIREQLTRIGKFMMKERRTLFQICHLATKNGKMYLVHAHEIMEMTNNKSPLTVFDLEERDVIANILRSWGYLTIVDESKILDVNKSMMREILIIPKTRKSEWNLSSIYDSI